MTASAAGHASIDGTLKVTSGRARPAHIAPDGRVTTLFELFPDAPSVTVALRFTAPPGENRVKPVMARGAALEMSLHFDRGNLHVLT